MHLLPFSFTIALTQKGHSSLVGLNALLSMGTSSICSALSMVPGRNPSFFFDDALTPTALLFVFVFFFFIDDNDDDDDDNEKDAANDLMCLSFLLSSLSLSLSLSVSETTRACVKLLRCCVVKKNKLSLSKKLNVTTSL